MSQHAHPEMQMHRAQWKSKWGFLFAAVGSAVGLGNIWRFSYLCYENGGGAFLIPYIIAMLTTGIPLLILEFGIGHRMRGSAPMSYAKVNDSWEWLGWWVVNFVMFGIVLYYSVIVAWCVCYVFFSFDLSWGTNPNGFFFNEFLQVSSGPGEIGDVRGPILLGLLAVWGVNWLIVFFGVQKGIERANKILMPTLFFLILVLVGWTLTLPGARDGIRLYVTPDFSKLTSIKVWVDSYSQAFFSLSLGFGIMVAYASYLPRKADINANACLAALVDSLIAIIAGFSVFGVLGYMMQSTGQSFSDVVSHGIGLAFVAYPKAISLLPSLNALFGIMFFLALAVAGISSCVSIIEAFASAVIDKFHYPRKVVVTVLSFVGFMGGLIFCTGGGLAWLDIVDHILSHYGLVTACLLQCILIGWVYGAHKLRDHVNQTSSFKISGMFDVLVRYIIPAILVLLLVHDIYMDARNPYGGYSWTAIILIGVNWLLATLVVGIFVAAKPWKKFPAKDTAKTG